MNRRKGVFVKKEYEAGVYVTNEKMEKEIESVRKVLRKLFENALISREENYFDEYGVILRAVLTDVCICSESEKRLFERAIRNAEYVEIIPLNGKMTVIEIGFTDMKIKKQDICN